jgi:hypothetical protein
MVYKIIILKKNRKKNEKIKYQKILKFQKCHSIFKKFNKTSNYLFIKLFYIQHQHQQQQ